MSRSELKWPIEGFLAIKVSFPYDGVNWVFCLPKGAFPCSGRRYMVPVVWMDLMTIASVIREYNSLIGLEGLRGMSLSVEVCHWGRVLRFQKPSGFPSQVPFVLCIRTSFLLPHQLLLSPLTSQPSPLLYGYALLQTTLDTSSLFFPLLCSGLFQMFQGISLFYSE